MPTRSSVDELEHNKKIEIFEELALPHMDALYRTGSEINP